MGLWSRIADFARAKAGNDPVGSELVDAIQEWGMTGAGMPVNSFTAMQHVAVMACVTILSEDVAKLPIRVYRRLENGGKKVATGHFLHKLLRHPNAWQNRFEFVEMMQAALVLRGNAYAVILRNERGQPTSLVPVHPDRVTLYEAPDGQYFFLVSRQGLHEMAVLSSLPIMIHSDDMFHVRWLSSWNSLIGLSRISLMRETVGLSMAQIQMAARLAGNGARPGGALQTDHKLTKEVIERIKADFQNTNGGWRNAGKTAVLEEGLKWQPIGMTMVDAEFIASLAWTKEDIAGGFRVPKHKLGIGDAGPGTALVQQDQEYQNNVLASYIERWIPKLEDLGGIDGEDYFIECDYDHVLKADIQTRYNAYRVAIVGGFKTVNEVRRKEGDPDDEKGNILLQPQNMVPLGTPPQSAGGAGPGSDTTGAPAAGGDGDGVRLPGDDPAPKS